ncbi:pyridoxamine 5'-phosphate oxidase-domain-containing protein [Neohortaea acidophila]|uniref:Pyridoxamine 5'-phosphate oxidase-domain-containing protein n=1 Tax=Neohortaea acidophila TaxID=245834 RepID=A0A6A6Q817_9PEZI|nr:pyridoxamine 5'-phosphate oxidase-domain-containing protein [Neohortaea acidophila]KAF2488221.1 pyridoxamine 5'-phosphate oxidase-domain-containing protein [Neohortaea acidophila]
MSSTSAQQQQAPAPWRDTFLSHINTMPSPEFVLATLHPAPKGSPTPYLPRARTCIFRGFWGELPENKHNDAPQNARVFESDLPTFTTDVRMQKAGEVFASSAGKADDDSLVQGSGGGGWCEAVWWAKEPSVQWRVRGRAFVVARDIEGEQGSEEGSGVRTVKSEVGGRMRVVSGKEEEKGEWSWGKELTAHFGNMSPTSKGAWSHVDVL